MKCRVCREPGVIDIRRHNANFCADHFLRYCRDQVARTIKEFNMADVGDRILVAVSGGKDSLALWDLLLELGYDVDGLYVGLGIGDYSDVSGRYVRNFVSSFIDGRKDGGATLREIDLRSDYDYDVPTAAEATGRAPCSACGLSKRHLFDKAARDGTYDVLMTGHNLDDEAAVLYGNVMKWQIDYLARQRPVLEAANGFPKKAKPLVRLSERETAAYCVLRGIDYQVEECPMAAGNRHLEYKHALAAAEEASPGMKQAFYFGYLREAAELFERSVDRAPDDAQALVPCESCGSPTSGDPNGQPRCAFCRLSQRAAGAEPVPVKLLKTRRR